VIDIPVGKALVPVPNYDCNGCFFLDAKSGFCGISGELACLGKGFSGDPMGMKIKPNRKDGKNVIFKLVDWEGNVCE